MKKNIKSYIRCFFACILFVLCVFLVSCGRKTPNDIVEEHSSSGDSVDKTCFCYNYDESSLSSFTRVYNGYYIRTDDGVDIVYSDIWPNVLEVVGSTSDLDFSDCAVGDYIRVDVYDINSENGSGKVVLNKYTPCEAENNQNGAEIISNIKAYLHLLGYKVEPNNKSTVIWGDTSITITPDSGCEYVLYAAPSNVNCCTAAVISKDSRTVKLKQRSIRTGAEYSEISHNDLAYWYTGCDNNSTESILIEGELSEMIEANDEVSDIFIYNCKFKEYTTGTNITDNYIQEGTLVAFGYEECDSMYCIFFEEAHWTIEEIKDLIGKIKIQF